MPASWKQSRHAFRASPPHFTCAARTEKQVELQQCCFAMAAPSCCAHANRQLLTGSCWHFTRAQAPIWAGREGSHALRCWPHRRRHACAFSRRAGGAGAVPAEEAVSAGQLLVVVEDLPELRGASVGWVGQGLLRDVGCSMRSLDAAGNVWPLGMNPAPPIYPLAYPGSVTYLGFNPAPHARGVVLWQDDVGAGQRLLRLRGAAGVRGLHGRQQRAHAADQDEEEGAVWRQHQAGRQAGRQAGGPPATACTCEAGERVHARMGVRESLRGGKRAAVVAAADACMRACVHGGLPCLRVLACGVLRVAAVRAWPPTQRLGGRPRQRPRD